MTTTVWGSWVNGGAQPSMRIGVEYYLSPSTVTSATTSVTVAARIRLEVNWGANDSSNTLTISGFYNNTRSISINVSNGDNIPVTEYFSTAVTPSYAGTVTRTVSATLTGIGAIPGTASVGTVTITVPRRPYGTPTAPGTPTVSSVGSTTLNLAWTQPGDWGGSGENRYRIQIATDASFNNLVVNATTANRYYNATGLSKYTMYYARVLAYNDDLGNGGGDSSWSGTRSQRTNATTPSAPGQPSASSITGTGFYSAWTALTDWGGNNTGTYEVQIDDNSGFTSPTTYTQSTLNKTFSGLTPGVLYYVRVRGTNAAGGGTWSATRSVQLLDYATAPQSLTLSNILATGFDVSWAAPADDGGAAVTSYRIQVATDAGFTNLILNTTQTGLSRSVTGLDPNTTYYVRVQAINSVGGGAYASTSSSTISAQFIKKNGAWQPVVGAFIKKSGVWREVVAIFVKKSGTWHQ